VRAHGVSVRDRERERVCVCVCGDGDGDGDGAVSLCPLLLRVIVRSITLSVFCLVREMRGYPRVIVWVFVGSVRFFFGGLSALRLLASRDCAARV